MVRQPAVAGRFYTGNPDELLRELASFMPPAEAGPVLGVIAPHAGYLYSGKTAGRVYREVLVPDAVIVLCPNHTGQGAAAALSTCSSWLTPLGPVPVNARLSRLILQHAPGVVEDDVAHRLEHSLEVQLPFLQYRNPGVTIAALSLALPDFARLAAIGEGIARAVAEYGDRVLIVASSDMTHYESARAAKEKDDLALAEIAALNPERLLHVCRERQISMCGVFPAVVMLVAAKALGATASRLVGYTTSGEVTGDLQQVVAYAGLTVC